MILDTIARSAGKRVEQRKQVKPLEQVMKEAFICREREGIKREDIKGEDGTGGGYSFKAALSKPGVSFICEVKKASPSKGLIAPDFPYVEIARQYQEAGADAVSVLTEPEFFLGADRYLEEIHGEIGLPLLRKDFTVDEYQIYEAKVIGADCILLIAAILSDDQMKEYDKLAAKLGMDVLVETHDEEEMERALKIHPKIIGVNNRNLKDFTISLENTKRLRPMVPEGTVVVSESGVTTKEHIAFLKECKVDALLIGGAFMLSEHPKELAADWKALYDKN